MTKPKVFIYDWKDKKMYKSLFDIAEIETDLRLPDKFDGISLVAFHSHPDNLKEVLKELQKRKISVIVELEENILEGELKRWGMENKGIECLGNERMSDKIREILENKKYKNTR